MRLPSRERLLAWLVGAAVVVHALDVLLVLDTPALETSPHVRALGIPTWTAVKLGLLVGLSGTAWLAREQRGAPIAAGAALAVGLVGVVGNLLVVGWTATDQGRVTVAVLVVLAVLPVALAGVWRYGRALRDAVTPRQAVSTGALAVVFALLVVTSSFLGALGGLTASGGVDRVSAAATFSDDFEDGDVSEWDGDTSGTTAESTYTAFNRSFYVNYTPSSGDTLVESDSFSDAQNVSAALWVWGFSSRTALDIWGDGTESTYGPSFGVGNNQNSYNNGVWYCNGSSYIDTGIDITKKSWYQFVVTDINPTANTYDLEVRDATGTTVGCLYRFERLREWNTPCMQQRFRYLSLINHFSNALSKATRSYCVTNCGS